MKTSANIQSPTLSSASSHEEAQSTVSIRSLTRPALLLLGLTSLLHSCARPAAATKVDEPVVPTSVTVEGSLSDQMAGGINRYRGEHGLPVLHRHSGLDALASQYAREMARDAKFEHSNLDYTEQLARHLHGVSRVEENIGRVSQASPHQVAPALVAEWIKSPGHRINLETMNTELGLGIAKDRLGSYYAVQLSGVAWSQARADSLRGGPRAYSNEGAIGTVMEW